MKKSKVCFFINQLDNSGGTERVTTVVANALSNIGYEVSVLTIQSEAKPFFELDTQISQDSLNYNNSGLSIVRRLKIISALRKYIASNKIDYLISVDSLLCIYSIPAVLATGVKNICWEHFNFNIDLGVKMRKISRYLAGAFADQIVVLSEKDKGFWERKLLLKNATIQAIYNPTAFPITTRAYNTNSKYVLGVGRLCSQKGFDLLLAAWPKIKSMHSDWRLVIAGDGEDRRQLELLAAELKVEDSVEFLGRISQLKPLYEDAAIFCFPSRFEGFGLALAEAQAFGLPAVAFDCDCGPSEILDDSNGILLELKQPIYLEQAIDKLIRELGTRVDMSSNAKKKAELFEAEAIIKKWDALLHEGSK